MLSTRNHALWTHEKSFKRPLGLRNSVPGSFSFTKEDQPKSKEKKAKAARNKMCDVQSEKQEQWHEGSSVVAEPDQDPARDDGFETRDKCAALRGDAGATARDDGFETRDKFAALRATDHEYYLPGIHGDQMRERLETSSPAHADACMDEAGAPHSPNFLEAIKDASVWGPGDALLLVTKDHQASLQERLARRRCTKLHSPIDAPVGSSRWIQPMAHPSSSRARLRGEIERLNRFDRTDGHIVLQS